MSRKKKISELYRERIRAILTRMGAIPYKRGTGGLYEWTIPVTIYGPLHVAVHEGSTDVFCQGSTDVFCRFEYPELASRGLDCNPFTGKWNFHFDDSFDAKECEAAVEERLDNILVHASDMSVDGRFLGIKGIKGVSQQDEKSEEGVVVSTSVTKGES